MEAHMGNMISFSKILNMKNSFQNTHSFTHSSAVLKIAMYSPSIQLNISHLFTDWQMIK